jgi:hypothetical protein
LQEYSDYLSSKNFQSSPVKTTRVVRSSKEESEKDNVAASPKIIKPTKSSPGENNNKADSEDKKLAALEGRPTKQFETYFKMFWIKLHQKMTKVKEDKELKDTKKVDKDESSEHVE